MKKIIHYLQLMIAMCLFGGCASRHTPEVSPVTKVTEELIEEAFENENLDRLNYHNFRRSEGLVAYPITKRYIDKHGNVHEPHYVVRVDKPASWKMEVSRDQQIRVGEFTDQSLSHQPAMLPKELGQEVMRQKALSNVMMQSNENVLKSAAQLEIGAQRLSGRTQQLEGVIEMQQQAIGESQKIIERLKYEIETERQKNREYEEAYGNTEPK